ncbi:MAG: spondin domain-containing protein [Planctomycetota bacterium]
MQHKTRVTALVAAAIAAPLMASSALAQNVGDIQVSITNEGNSDFFLTPMWFAFQNGTFDLFDTGSAASPALEALAEDGIVDGLTADFASSGVPGNRQGVAANADGFGGAPVIDPGETATAFVVPINPAAYQYFTFASMVIPSNDTFIGNGDPFAHQVFNGAGDINDASGTFTIQVFGSDLYDAGTEVNDANGAAFSALGGTSSDEGGVVNQNVDLSNFLGTPTAAGTTILDGIDSGELLATIEISFVPVPSPATAAVLGLPALALVRRRR